MVTEWSPLEAGEVMNIPIGQRIRQLRELKQLSQGDIERQTGMLRGYISRVEHGHTVPSVETLHKFAFALDLPLYRLFYASEDGPARPSAVGNPDSTPEEKAQTSGSEGTEARFLLELKGLVGHLVDSDRAFLLELARKLATRGAPIGAQRTGAAEFPPQKHEPLGRNGHLGQIPFPTATNTSLSE
jgi:transcriptional regulator with XRE-family HTH domain